MSRCIRFKLNLQGLLKRTRQESLGNLISQKS